ncbi:soluble lytic transglycosylase, SLT domain [Bradyrhizobium oligotrophicum S58]|uniref:Soluble lytic transglycosylase, SLT domain n=1 Tax=Bradyrhizobium oligotrophicum S58 TaxID=1245469 RepID=M4Z3M1_9BRAD|nr:transglycosylase SLT domain-containing protein [Bradyrhizobium oligotrophicum]BAM87654.1 soluble lytic transglycosylase, SLT domain [Bradyrhizobium oligotrophicum S58]
MKRLISALAAASVIATTMPAFAGSGLHELINSAADQHGLAPSLVHAVIRVESNYNCRLTGRAGERGIMQVKPATARSVGVTGDLYDCSTGLRAGLRYLRIAISRGGVGCAGISLYQRGVYGRPVCTAYGRKVLRAANLRSSGAAETGRQPEQPRLHSTPR